MPSLSARGASAALGKNRSLGAAARQESPRRPAEFAGFGRVSKGNGRARSR